MGLAPEAPIKRMVGASAMAAPKGVTNAPGMGQQRGDTAITHLPPR